MRFLRFRLEFRWDRVVFPKFSHLVLASRAEKSHVLTLLSCPLAALCSLNALTTLEWPDLAASTRAAAVPLDAPFGSAPFDSRA